MDKFYSNIKLLIENNLVEIKKQEISKNSHTLMTYYNIGKILVEAQGDGTRAKYGNELINNYSIQLTQEFGKGYTVSNLRRMRQFYLCYPKGVPAAHQLTWTHYYLLLPIKDINKRNYYINAILENNLGKRQLIQYIKSNAYERLSYADKNNIKLKYVGNNEDSLSIFDMIKEPILISINESGKNKVTEKALKRHVIDQIEKTMLELGVGFSFVGSEQKIKVGNNYRYVDLVFFNYELNCFVLIELKINKLDIRDIGQIEFYINYYDAEIRKPFHNQTIGIIICNRNDKSILKYQNKGNLLVTSYELIE